MKHVKVTVYLSTYNQEEYVAQALDSILMQKTDFPFEVVAADDCSTDATQQIILDYQKRYPDIIVTYFTDPNVGGCKKLTDCIDSGLFRGDYLAYLEGDDYWLGEDRLQVLVDFLEAHPEYSRVSHKRRVMDENGNDKGFDISPEVLEKPFTVKDFLDGKNYSDFGSVFRNYFKTAGDKYHPLIQASRNVCDFQDMFITQDFGPVYVMDRCFGVYRSRSVAGASNYNSVTTQSARCKDHIRICRAVEQFYNGRYDLSPMIFRNQTRLVAAAVAEKSAEQLNDARKYVPAAAMRKIAPELLYRARRGKRGDEMAFIKARLTGEEKKGLTCGVLLCAAKHIWYRLTKNRPNDVKRGEIK